jgi:hypothetical protein
MLGLALRLQAAGQEGVVTGTLTLNGAPAAITHVYASAQRAFFDPKAEDVRILFSDAPISDADRKDVFALIRLGREGKARILECVVDRDGQVISGALFAKEFEGQVSVTGMHKFARERFERAAIAGRMSTQGVHEFMKVEFQYDLRFSAPIPRSLSAAERAEALASPPARAATAYLAAVKRGDLAAVRAAAARAAAIDAGRLKELREDMPADVEVVALEPQVDGSVLAKVEGHRDGIIIGYTLRMVLEGNAWKVTQ